MDLPAALTRLLATNFYAPANLVREMLAHDADRKSHIPPNYVVERVLCSSKAARGEDAQIEHPVWCGYSSAFHFHPTLPGMPGATLVGHQVV